MISLLWSQISGVDTGNLVRDSEFESLVRRRIFENVEGIIAMGRASCLSLDVLNKATSSEIAIELKISTAEAERLKQSEEEWSKSLCSILHQIHLEFGKDIAGKDLAKRSCDAIAELAKRPEDLKNLSETDQLRIPLVVKFWLKNHGLLNDQSEDRQRSFVLSPPHAELSCSEGRSGQDPANLLHSNVQAANPSVGEDFNQREKSDSAGHQCRNDTGSPIADSAQCSTGRAEDVLHNELSERLLSQRRASYATGDDANELESRLNEDKPDKADRLDWDQGQRLEVVCCSSGELKSGTLMFVSETDCIVLRDDFQLQKIKTRTTKLIPGAQPILIESSLIAAILKAYHSSRSSASMINEYLQMEDGAQSKLEAVAYASGVLARKYPRLEFQEVVGNGGYGTVVRVCLVNGDSAVIKLEISSGCPEVTDLSLWRESNILSKPPSKLTGHVPKLCKAFGSYAFIRIFNGYRTIGLLSMESLLPFAETVFNQKRLIDGKHIPDDYRHTAQEQLYVLKVLHENGLSHCDIKSRHWMASGEHSKPVLIDFGLSERASWFYTHRSSRHHRDKPAIGQILLASDSPPERAGASAREVHLKRMGKDRPGTPGLRPQSIALDHHARQQADLWALGVGWLEGVGVAPSPDTCEQFEKRLYASLHSVEDFMQMIREFQTVSSTILCRDGNLHPSVSIWLAFVYSILSGGKSALEMLQGSPMLTQPFYKPTTLEKLRTKGIIVPGVWEALGKRKRKSRAMKPVLLMHVQDIGLIVLCLLWYLPDECFARYGGKLVDADSAEALYSPCHNLSVGGRQIIFGAVSKHFGIEDFINHSAIGSFIKSSNYDPAVQTAGSLRLPPRYDPEKTGDMTVVPMSTRLSLGPGMQPTWPYPWNAGTGTALYSLQEISKMQAMASQSLPDHVWTALAEARMQVLRDGSFRDADVPASTKATLLPLDMPDTVRKAFVPMLPASPTRCQPSRGHPDAESRAETAESLARVLPLPQELVACIESAFSRDGGIQSSQIHDWSDTKQSADMLETDDQFKRVGLLHLDSVPKIRTQAFEKALLAEDGGQGIVFMNASNLALTSSKRLKEVIANGEMLYAMVCQTEPRAENTSDAAGESPTAPEFGSGEGGDKGSPGFDEGSLARDCPDSGPADNSRGAHRQAGDNSSAGEGPGSGGDSSSEPTLAAWLLIVLCYLRSIPDKYWNVIFQHTHGSDAERSGDGKRSECKGDAWPKPEKATDESEDSFLKKLAGYYALQYFFSELFQAIINILPRGACFTTQFWPCMTSFLASDKTDGDVEAQDPHNDKEPVLGERCYSLLVNLSNLFTHLGILINSCPNIKRMLQLDQNEFGQFRERFLKTYSVSQPDKLLSEAMGEAELEAKILFAWQQYLADQHLAEFAEIFPVYAKMPPVMVALFDTDCTHWGAPYPMPDIVYPSDYQLVHYR